MYSTGDILMHPKYAPKTATERSIVMHLLKFLLKNDHAGPFTTQRLIELSEYAKYIHENLVKDGS